MTQESKILVPQPQDATPDSGPYRRGGPFAIFVALTCGLTALGAGLVLLQQGALLWACVCLVFFGSLAARASWCLIQKFRHHGELPRLHAVLTGTLAFRVHCTCRDVAATVFMDDDALQAGASARLLCFVENYASRQRIAHFTIGPHKDLGLPQTREVSLHLAAGQAAVYALPLLVSPSFPAGDHDLPVTLKVHKPNGTGVRLPGSRRHLYDLWTVRFAAPFTIAASDPAGKAPASVALLEEPSAKTLASASEKGPRMNELQALLAAPPKTRES